MAEHLKLSYNRAPKANSRPSQSFTTNSRDVPWHVGNSPSEFHALGCVLGIKRIGIFDDYVRVEQFVPVFVRIGCGRFGAAEVNHLPVAR